MHDTEREKTKNKRQKDTNTTTKHRTLRRRESEAIPVLKKRIFFSYFYCSTILLWRTVVVIGLFVARRPAISTVTKAEIIQKLKRKIW